MDWKLTGASPVYLQVMEHIRHGVLTGEYPPGTKIPSVRELSAQARVNPNTMQRALAALEQEGLLLAHGTLGRFVTENTVIIEKLRSDRQISVVRRCRELLADVGLTLAEAAEMEEN